MTDASTPFTAGDDPGHLSMGRGRAIPSIAGPTARWSTLPPMRRLGQAGTTMGRLLAAVLLFVPSLAAAQPAPLTLPQVGWANGIAGAGDRVWVAGSNQGLIELAPGQAPRRITGPRSATAIAASEHVVVVAEWDRTLHVVRDGQWTRGPTPPEGRFGDHVAALAISARGTIFALAESGGLHTWDGRGRRVRTVALSGENEARHLALAGERAYVTGDHRMLLEVQGRRARRPAFANAVMNALDRDYQELGALWVSPTTGHLWIGTSADRVLEVDLGTNRVTVYDTGLFGLAQQITGTVIDGDEVVVVAAQSDLATVSGGQVSPLAGDYVFLEGMYVQASTQILYVASRDGVRAISLRDRRPIEATPVEVTTASTESAPPSAGTGSAPPPSAEGGGVRFEDVRLEGQCGLFGTMALIAQAQERAGRCVAARQSVTVHLDVRGSRARTVEAEGPPAACVRRRLARLPVPGAPRCDVRFRMVH